MVIAMQLLMGVIGHAQTYSFFKFGSEWRFLDNGSDQGATWKDVGFNDASWTSDTGTFGYNDPWITRCINACGVVSCSPSCGTKYITTYFRKVVDMGDISRFDSVEFAIMRDDGFVMYVNGVEVARDNMPAGTPTYTTSAPSAIGSANEYTPITRRVPISAFVSGNNTIAVEVHQNGGSSSDVTFNVQMKGFVKTGFINTATSWKYNTGSDQGTAWRNESFNDVAWPSGNGRFGYGESYITTCVAAGPSCSSYPASGPCNSVGSGCVKYPAIYFRTNMDIADTSLYDSVRFSVIMDDGAVMYVNGTEVWRHNMPAGTISYTTLTPNTIAENTAVIVTLPITSFKQGANLIAFELHQTGTTTSTSSDADFGVQANGILYVDPTLLRGPYLQMGNQDAFTVRWRTDFACKSRLEVGTSFGTYPIVVEDAAAVTEHEVRVTGLAADTKYYYRFGSDRVVLQGDTTNFCVTAPADGSHRRVTIAAYGDCGTNSSGNQAGALSAYRSFLTSMGMQAADLMLLVGDNAYNSGTDGEYQTGFFNAYQSNILKNHMLFPAPGNHDYANLSARQDDHNIPYLSIFSLPKFGECGGVASGKEEYYSFNWGDVHVLSLDSYGEESNMRLYDTNGAQAQWVKADLAANTKKWVIAYWHHPPYTMGSHNSDNEGELINMRQRFIRILERYGVDLIICGHSHDYERSYLLRGHYGNEASFDLATHAVDNSSAKYDGSANSCPYKTVSGQVEHGTVYVVSGSSGASGNTQAGYPHDAMPFSINDGGMFFIDINNNRLDGKFIRKNGTVWDQFTIMKDVNVQDTVKILNGESVDISASWEGNYVWTPTETARTINVTPANDTLIAVKDAVTGTCLTDMLYVDLLCTTPDIVSVPANITREGCDAMVTYSVSDTGRPSGTYTYEFSGATVATGNGTGSGSVFSTGVTTVTLTITNECGSNSRSFTVTIKPLPVAQTLAGGGGYCPGGTGRELGLINTQMGVTYQLYNGSTMMGAAVAGTGGAVSLGTYTAHATYSVLATDDVTGCTNAMANTQDIEIFPLPVTQTVSGGGNYCSGGAGVAIGLASSQAGVNYQLYNGTATVGSVVAGTGSAVSFGIYSTVATYSVMATDAATTCVAGMSGVATVGINPLPAAFNVTGGGHYCSTGAGVTVSLDGSVTGVNYQLYNGATNMGAPVAGSGAAISFGSHTTAGTYTAVATDAATGCMSDMTGSATVTIDPLPTVFNMNAGGNYCSGGTGVEVTLSGSETAAQYQLYYGAAMSGSAVTGSGSVLSFGMKTAAGTYTVMATYPATGCVSEMLGASVVGIYGLPNIYAVTGGGSFCAGGAGVAVGLGGTEAGISYALYNGATPTGVSVNGTGLPVSFGMQTVAGTYNVIATDMLTGCTNTMASAASVVVTPLSIPSSAINVFPDDTVCAGTMLTFNALPVNGGVTPNFEWKVNGATMLTGSPVFSYLPSNGDLVSVIIYSSLPCLTVPATTADKAVGVLPAQVPVATVSVSPSDSVCEGIPVSFSVSSVNGGTAPVYTWLKNSVPVAIGDTFSYLPAHGDGVVVSMTSNAQCRTSDIVYSNLVAMKVDDSYLPVVTISAVPGLNIAQGQSVTFTASADDAGIAPSYKWKKNSSIIAGAVSGEYTTSALADKDTITCIVTGSGLCGHESFNSVVMNVVALGVNTVSAKGDIRIIPNPTAGVFTIDGSMNYTSGKVRIAVTDVLGREVYNGSTDVTNGRISAVVSLNSQLAEGTYLLTLEGENGRESFHVILKK